MYKAFECGILMGMEPEKIAGFLLINKPKDITSFTVVKRIQKLVGGRKIKVGHTGTLDPFATGLLIIAIDRRATKHIDQFLKLDKIYIAQGKLGELTDTLDYTGAVIQTSDASNVTNEGIQEAIKKMGSSYIQTPPIYAALKHKGQPLYKLARQKKLSVDELETIVQYKKREISLYELELLAFEPPFFTIKAHVSHGTYIRCLVNDIAQLVGSIATTYQLERTAIGPFTIEQAVDLEALATIEDVEKHLGSIESFLQQIQQ